MVWFILVVVFIVCSEFVELFDFFFWSCFIGGVWFFLVLYQGEKLVVKMDVQVGKGVVVVGFYCVFFEFQFGGDIGMV